MNIMAKWIKKAPYGDYKDPLQNHKYDGEIQFKDEKNKVIIIRTRLHELLHQCRTIGTHGKHVGSKPYKNLIAPLARIGKVRSAYNKAMKALNSIKETNTVTTTE